MAPYILFEGFRTDARTRDMLVEARKNCDAPLFITQGGFNKGGVSASAGTHDGGGALDIRVRNLSPAQILEAVLRLRQVGFFASHRLPSEGPWVEHIHCIAVGCPSLSSGAKAQVRDYLAGKNGLANHKADRGNRTYAKNTWESYQASMANTKPPAGSTPSKPPTSGVDMNIVASSIRYAATAGSYFHSGQAEALKDAREVVNWAGPRRQKALTEHDVRVWDTHIRNADWQLAGQQYRGLIRKIQIHWGLVPDGVFGPKTAAVMATFGYTIL